MRQKGRGPFEILGVLDNLCRQNQRALTVTYALSFCFVIASDFVPFSTILLPSSRLSVLNRRRANFLWKFLFAGGFGGATKSFVLQRSPLTRTFAEQKCLVTAKDQRFAARQENRCIYSKIGRNCKTEREYLRNRKHSLILSEFLFENPRNFNCFTP